MAREPFLLEGAYLFKQVRGRVGVFRMPRQNPTGPHCHDFWEMVIVLSGEGLHLAGSMRHRIQAGDVLILHRDCEHAYEEADSLNLVNVVIADTLVERMERDLGAEPGFHLLFNRSRGVGVPGVSWLRLDAAALVQVLEWVDLLDVESRKGEMAGELLAEAYLLMIIALLTRKWSSFEAGRRNARDLGLFAATLSWIESHLGDSFSVADLAMRAGMSERGFYRHFKMRLGMTPHAYILKSRLELARQLAHRPQRLSTRDIAERCGFSDASALCVQFKRAYGLTLGETRRRVSGKTQAKS